MTHDLAAFLRARLDDDEQAAHKAAALCGCHPESPSWTFGDESTDGRILVVNDPHPDVRRKLSRRWNGSYGGLFTAEHIVRHDPTRILAEVKAKRRIIDRYENYDTDAPELDVPRSVLEALALPYADHPDYQELWRP